jgi:hypothetical protein
MKTELGLDFLEVPMEELEQQKRQYQIVIEARKTLQSMVRTIKDAGGAITEEELAKTTLWDLSTIAAQNKLHLDLTPTLGTPKKKPLSSINSPGMI